MNLWDWHNSETYKNARERQRKEGWERGAEGKKGSWCKIGFLEDKGKMLNSLSYEPAHTKDSLKQKRHYFGKQGQGALVDCRGQSRRKVLSSINWGHSKEATHGRPRSVPQVQDVDMTQVQGETDRVIKNQSWMCWIRNLCWLRSHIEKGHQNLLFRVFIETVTTLDTSSVHSKTQTKE